LPAAMPVTTEIFSVIGARVRVLSNERLFGPGDNRITWDGKNDYGSPVASGVYYVQVRTRLGTKVTRAVLLK
jgi:flagellar hook assembly protein FlgD